MVNSPSRPNLRPVVSPPLGGFVRAQQLLHRPGPETLAAPPQPNDQGKSNQFKPNQCLQPPSPRPGNSPYVYIRVYLRSKSPFPSFVVTRLALLLQNPFKTAKIKINPESTPPCYQAPAYSNRHSSTLTLCALASLRLCVKTPAIKPHQGISSQPPNFRSAPVPGAVITEPSIRPALPIPIMNPRPQNLILAPKIMLNPAK